MQCRVTKIYNYPVKSCRGTSVDHAKVTRTGITGDRQLMILHKGAFTNQARLPLLARVTTERVSETSIRFGTDHDSVLHEIHSDGDVVEIDFYGNPIRVIDQGDEVADLVSAVISKDVRVAALENSFSRQIPLEEFTLVHGEDQSQFVDVAPLLVTNEASLADLNGRLDTPVPMDRFRANIVVSGLDAYAEDDKSSLSIDGLRLRRMTHCERCAVTCTDQETGERATEPLAMLKSYRHRDNGYAGGVMFGAYMAVEGEGDIRVGDTLAVG